MPFAWLHAESYILFALRIFLAKIIFHRYFFSSISDNNKAELSIGGLKVFDAGVGDGVSKR